MSMNLGAETLREVTTSRPELVHRSSQRSIAASDDFYSLSERGVSPASSDEATTVIRHTSPEQQRTAVSPLLPRREPSPPRTQRITAQEQSSDIFYPSRSTPSPAPATDSRQEPAQARQTTPSIRHVSEEPGSGAATPRPSTIVRAASGSTHTTQQMAVRDIQSHPAPPVPAAFQQSDNRFSQRNDPVAVSSFINHTPRTTDSLGITGMGNGMGRSQSSAARSVGTSTIIGPSTSPNIRQNRSSGVPGDGHSGPGWEWQTSRAGNPIPTPGIDPTPELRFAIDQITRDEEIAGVGRDSYVATAPSSQYSQPDEQTAPSRPSEGAPRGSGASATPFIQQETALPQPPPTRGREEKRTSVSNRYSLAPSAETKDYKRLRAVPTPLTYASMIGLILLCVVAVVLLVYSSVHSGLSGGLTRYDGTGTSLYFVYKYLPQLFAAVIILWLHYVQDAIQRILPFVLLIHDSHGHHDLDTLQTTPRYKTSYLLPDVTHFRHGEVSLAICNIVFWMTLFTVPLASTLYTPTYFTSINGSHWQWNAVQAICWTLIPLYFLLIVALLFVTFRFNIRPTSLVWDPVSLADLFVLLRRGNTTIPRYSADSGKFAGRPDTRPASLGLWRSPSNANGLSHGIGIDIENAGRLYSPPPLYDPASASDLNSPYPVSHFDSWQTNHPDGLPWLPWFLRPSPLALWIALALALVIAFLVVSWVNHAVQIGFDPLLFAGSRGHLNFSSANFLYGFLPALLGMFCYLFWQPIDATFRALQPFAEMQKHDKEGVNHGASADRSILLDYNTRPPLAVTIEALRNRHYRVAWLSFVTVLSLVIPVLAGGVFEAQYIVGSTDTIHEIASIPGYIALCVFVVVYALSYLAIWPSSNHRLPHDIGTVGDIADFVIGSRMLNDVIWRNPPSKTMLVTDLVSQRRLTGEKMGSVGNFCFGEHLGLDGKPRLGVYRSS